MQNIFTQKTLAIGMAVVAAVLMIMYVNRVDTTSGPSNLDGVTERAVELAASNTPSVVALPEASTTDIETVVEATATPETAQPVAETKPAPAPVVKPTPTPTPVVTPAPAPTPTPIPAPTPTPVVAGITKAEVATHASADSCWSIINGSVYDLTSYITRHPGGKSAILGICGKDGTRMFEGQHGGDSKPERVLSGLYLDDLAS